MDEFLQSIDVVLTDEMRQKFETYFEFLTEENEKYNLTAVTEHDEVWTKHFVDSMTGSPFVPQGATLVDVGAGAGFPSLPLAIVRPDIKPTLVDSLGKRVNFCSELCKKIGVNAVTVHARAEDFAKDNRQKFDVAVARAVAPLNILLEYLAPLVKLGGSVIAYKTDRAETETAQNAARVLGLNLYSVNPFVLPDGSNRCLLVYTKVRATPPAYPRGQNKPRKNPL